MPIGEIEKITQNRVIDLFVKKLGYTYLGDYHDRENSNVEVPLLERYLISKKYPQILIGKAIRTLLTTSGNQSKTLYEVNQDTYSLLRYGAKEKETAGMHNQTVFFIDWEHPYENNFYIAEEVTIVGNNKKRPDLVLYINGIALGVIELKRGCVSVSNGIRQNIINQRDNFIKPFFTTIALIIAGNDTEGLRYGVIETPEKYYLAWKEDGKATDVVSVRIRSEIAYYDKMLDKNLISVCSKDRFIELLHGFIVYDKGIKKVCRQNQYFGVKAAQVYVKTREGGIIWHTQGSGKSLTMVWLTKWIKENIPDSRILIITDRDELDEQIEKVFKGVNENIYRTKSGNDLINKINDTTPKMICTLIHKFGRHSGDATEKDYEHFIEELRMSLPDGFSPKGDFYVFVDECHRTQSGKLHKAMKAILGKATFYGFTGTPLMKKDKQSSLEVFGPYIHKYKFDEAVKDKVVLDLRYESRYVDQNVVSQDKIDEWFDIKTRGLNDVAKALLKKRWGNMQKIFSSKSRLTKIASDIIFDFATKDRLQNGKGNAMLVASSIYQACKYYEIFQGMNFKKCAIVTSYEPNVADVRTEGVGDDGETETFEQYEIYQKMLGGKDVKEFETEAKKLFTESPAQMQLLIVVDKLLTGFDAPPCTYLYLDKTMRDHGLFQAICRVNRLDGEDKEFGYIVDYKDLFVSLENAVKDYTAEAFDAYDKEDVQGLLSDRLEKAKEHLDEILDSLYALCEPVKPPKGTIDYIHYFCGQNQEDLDELKENEPKREQLYKLTASLIRAYAEISGDMSEAGYTTSDIIRIAKDVVDFKHIRDEIKLASGDYIDLKAYEPDMRHLIDTYISAEESKKRTALDNFSLIELLVSNGEKAVEELPNEIKKDKESVAETIENNVRRKIVEKSYSNPKYFDKMSILLKELIDARKREAISYEEYLKQIVELTRNVVTPENSVNYPDSIKTSSAKRAFYDNLGENEELANKVHFAVLNSKEEGFRGNVIKERRICRAIAPLLGNDKESTEDIFKIIYEQEEY